MQLYTLAIMTIVPSLYTHHRPVSGPKTHIGTAVLQLFMTNTTRSQKRKRTDDGDHYADSAQAPLPKKKSTQEAVHGGPTKAFGSKWLMKGMLFNASYVLGRDTVVWTSRRDVGRVSARKVEQSENALEIVSKHIHDNVPRLTVVNPEDSTLWTFTPDGIEGNVLETMLWASVMR
ncbi:hypothetical protein F5I97DRAFT_1835819 [Phlebopus sp. FC_14]|nr:hypothetical protein F5I97DRAFT_1835819 [Phlebopus sp. FC_14]